MKIAILRKKYTFHGGAEGFSSSFIELLAAQGHEIHIFAIQWQSDQSLPNVHFHAVPVVSGISFLRDLTFALATWYMLRGKRQEFDIIQTHDKTLCQDIYRAGDGCHREWLTQRWRRTGIAGRLSMMVNPYHWLILFLECMILKGRRYQKIIAISEMVKNNIVAHYGVAPDDIDVIYNGVDLERFTPGNRELCRQEVRDAYGLQESDIVILFAGSGFERKGVKYLLEAVEAVPSPVSVLIVGKGSAQGLIEIVRRQKVHFCGAQKDIHKYYAAADLFVFPTMYEPFGNVHLEALASGLPVITTKQSGGAEIIRDGEEGFVVEKPEDVPAIAAAIKVLVNDREKLAALSRNARKCAEEFTFERHIGKITELYKQVIASRPPSRDDGSRNHES